ncbi:hypothetical protein [Rhodoferax sp.]|uniref:hypothetical protein n=1 Tax=Rhodoferax sp. TaxID=50421 RepID=UPI00284A6997|nr:hypothetical protein [Rhodoferax sp.]MDR3369717.1 hypothetical protein [Rhodoferax sp.]
MKWLNKLPGFQRTPYGFELRLLRLMPQILLAGAVLPALSSWMARLAFTEGSASEIEHRIEIFDFIMLGVATFIWATGLTVGIGCIIVWLMKGPAYVADGYEVSHSDKPKE